MGRAREILAAALLLAVACDDRASSSSAPAGPSASIECPGTPAGTVRVASVQAPRRLVRLRYPTARVGSEGLSALGWTALDSAAAARLSPGDVLASEVDGLATSGSVPTDPRMGEQWHHAAVGAPQAWARVEGRSLPAIAVIDSGVFTVHPELGTQVLPGWSFLTGTSDTSDQLGHGTTVSGTCAAKADNGLGGAGVAFGAQVVPLVVLDAGDRAWYSDIARAIVYAADQGIRIINVSVGGETASDVLQSAVDYAWARGCVVFASAMNRGSTVPQYPAACERVVAVGAVDWAGRLASFSGRGPWVDLVAPGQSILTTVGAHCFGYKNGTSYASPIVASVAALILAARPELGAQALVDLITATCDDLGDPGVDDLFGAGRVNAARAVAAALTGM